MAYDPNAEWLGYRPKHDTTNAIYTIGLADDDRIDVNISNVATLHLTETGIDRLVEQLLFYKGLLVKQKGNEK